MMCTEQEERKAVLTENNISPAGAGTNEICEYIAVFDFSAIHISTLQKKDTIIFNTGDENNH
ncbi:hypothetical protein [Methanoplanus endosymbiosus]|uniref:Uncharacterized protein n=1 Tax=Methanoplanus endosymbiosus TaxID=33865 RepID=A0A9E7PMD5_9EURY|nr:hypothetical protein [Methanoplanus endosymbiosus]UUX92869.1 hypothetical protein L6E24_01705 [Methanoplanus endosymbiosus]